MIFQQKNRLIDLLDPSNDGVFLINTIAAEYGAKRYQNTIPTLIVQLLHIYHFING